ncbi:hypothetical protein BV22DRAFT_1040338 [Leucogyrophana mollusca]|uniref:Uncharacterized protein n=1 Tax=Leucogyrophana mollusca TaxID=85980 RepID=A0ACB8B2W6_9AGAM|nr:hypothetical protein BV22DRAFT_1040338 [Leucogyrophana mollusca]
MAWCSSSGGRRRLLCVQVQLRARAIQFWMPGECDPSDVDCSFCTEVPCDRDRVVRVSVIVSLFPEHRRQVWKEWTTSSSYSEASRFLPS